MDFNHEYPLSPPTCKFTPAVFHPNVHASGMVYLSLIGKDWKPQVTIKQILLEVQTMLNEPDLLNNLQLVPYMLYCNDKLRYERTVRESIKYASK